MEQSFSNGDRVIIHAGYIDVDGTNYFGIYGIVSMIPMHEGEPISMIKIEGDIYGDHKVVYLTVAAVYGITRTKQPNTITSPKILKLQSDE
jgi:hypothetical protein